MIHPLDNLECLVDGLENQLTMTLGFEVPETLSYNQALELITAIQEPLRTDIKQRLLTCTYAVNDTDIRWLVITALVRFGVRYGKMKDVGREIAEEFYTAISCLGDRVFTLLQNTESFPPTRYGYLKSVVAGFCHGFRAYDSDRLKFVNKENFIVLDDTRVEEFFNQMSHDFSGISDTLTRMGKEMCVEKDTFSGLPSIISRLNYINDKDDLRNLKSYLRLRIDLIKTFNEVLDTF